ncbi:MAG: BPSL0067 family protein [Azoarcus sp.]|jgi:hypothetical protein|nr:BPSL0067 family protein [Azoarcus sp.]
MGFIVDLKKCAELAAKNEWVSTQVDIDAGYGRECTAAVKALIASAEGKVWSTSAWRRGKKVVGNNIMPGTAIATFPIKNGKTGEFRFKGHAAILVEYYGKDIVVYDQWKPNPAIINDTGNPFSKRKISPKCDDYVSNDAEAFFVIELVEEPSGEPALCGKTSNY